MNRKLLRRMTLPIIVACLALADCSNTTTTSAGPPTAFAVLRFTTSGAPDTNFGGGVVTTAITPGLSDFALAVAVQPDSKIVAGGSSGLAGQGTIALVRYNTDGTLDTTGFGTAGIVRTPLAGVTAGASAIALEPPPSNKIIVAALTFVSTGNTGIALLRYNTNGTLDTTFNAADPSPGIVTAAIGPGLAGDTCALALQGDGKIVVAGASQNGNLVLYRYDATGVLDPNFGTNGTGGNTITTLPTAAMSPALALQSSGKIVLVSGTNVDQVVLRYNTNGTLDITFGPTQTVPGIVVTDINNSVNFANTVAVQADDKIIVAGHANVNFNADTSDISLVRYTVDGALDPTFGATQPVQGIVVTDLGGRFDNVFSIALQTQPPADPLILLSGNAGFTGISQVVVLRYTPLGALDTTFGTNGVVGANLVGPSNIASGNAVVLQSVGGNLAIVVAGFD